MFEIGKDYIDTKTNSLYRFNKTCWSGIETNLWGNHYVYQRFTHHQIDSSFLRK